MSICSKRKCQSRLSSLPAMINDKQAIQNRLQRGSFRLIQFSELLSNRHSLRGSRPTLDPYRDRTLLLAKGSETAAIGMPCKHFMHMIWVACRGKFEPQRAHWARHMEVEIKLSMISAFLCQTPPWRYGKGFVLPSLAFTHVLKAWDASLISVKRFVKRITSPSTCLDWFAAHFERKHIYSLHRLAMHFPPVEAISISPPPPPPPKKKPKSPVPVVSISPLASCQS
jgi:hypothetical protein